MCRTARRATSNVEALTCVGAMSPDIEIAKRSGIPFKIAAKVDDADLVYFKNEILPLLKHPLIEFLGEINENQKCEFLSKARALLFPIGVMIEAMWSGTLVIAWRNGSGRRSDH